MKYSRSRRGNPNWTGMTSLAVALILFITLVPSFASSDPTLTQTGPTDMRFTWDFTTPSDYTLSSAVIENGSLQLAHSNLSYYITSEQDFKNGTLLNLDATTDPDAIRLLKLAPELFQDIYTLDNSNSRDSYIENYTPELCHGSENAIMVGNDANGHSYRSLLAIDPSLIDDMPWDVELIDATLSIYQESSTYSNGIGVHAGTGIWSEGSGVWNGSVAVFWVNETEGYNRTNEPIIVEIVVPNLEITDPNCQLILYNHAGLEYPSRILSWTILGENNHSVKIGFPVTSSKFESQRFVLKLLDSTTPIPSYRIVVPSPTMEWSMPFGDLDCTPALADLNHDGLMEIIAFNSLPTTPIIKAFSINKTLLWTYTFPGKADLENPLVVADINLDGEIETLFTQKDGGYAVLSSTGNLMPAYTVPGYTGYAIPAVADLNLDGIPEIVVSCIASASSLACINGLTGAIIWQNTLASTCKGLGIGDFNASDGLEIAVAQWSGQLRIYDYSGNMLWGHYFANTDFGKTIGAADLNGDSIEDIVLGDSGPNGHIFAANGVTGYPLWSFLMPDAATYSDGLAIADINEDGLNETIALQRSNTYSAVVAISNTGIELWNYTLAANSYGAITIADFNGDGNLEILVGDRAASVNVLSASGAYLESITVSFNKAIDKVDNAPIIADINGDVAFEMVTLSDSNLTLMKLAGFSYDWRQRGRDDTLGSAVKGISSHEGVDRLQVDAAVAQLLIMAVNWTHATDTDPWLSPGGDFNSTNFGFLLSTGMGIWHDINITTIIADWISSGRIQLNSIYFIANDDTEGLTIFASTETSNAIRHPILTIEYRITRYTSIGIFTSTILGDASTTHWTGLSANWTKNLNTDIAYEFRFGNSTSPGDASWSSWTSIALSENEALTGISAFTKYVQIRATLTNTNISFSPILREITASGLRYASHGYAITNDAILSEVIQGWNSSWAAYDSNGGVINLNFSVNSGSNWVTIAPDGDISVADKSTGKLRLKIDLWGVDYPGTSAWTPVVYSASASYIQYSGTLTPPVISPQIPDQIVNEDSALWIIDLSLYLSDANDPQSMLRWYVLNESMVSIGGENNTGSMTMMLSIPINVNGVDKLTIIVVDTTGMSASQDFNVTIIPMNDAPTINSIPTFTADPDTPRIFDFGIYISDIETPKSLLNLSILGINATFVTINGLTGTFLIPEYLNGTDVQFQLMVDDGNLSAIRNFTVSVSAVTPPQPPVISPVIPNQFKNEDSQPWNVSLSPYLSDPNEPQNMLRWYVLNETIVNVQNENQTGMLDMLFSLPANLNGIDEITIVVVDSSGRSSRQDIVINVAPVNDAPEIGAISDFTVRFDYPFTLNLTPYVSDIDNTLGELTLSATGGSSSYVTFNHLNATFTLPKSLNGSVIMFTIRVSDGSAYASTNFNVTVSADYPPRVNNPLPDVTLNMGELKANLFNLSDYFGDIDDTTLFFAVGNVHVTITIDQATNMVSFLGPSDWYGIENATFKAIDPDNARAEDTILIIVLPGYDPPTISQIPDLRVRYDDEYKLDLSTYVQDPDTPMDDLNFRTNISSQYIYFEDGMMKIRFPASASGHTYIVVLTVNDGISNATCTFKVIVSDEYPPGFHPLPDWTFEEDNPQNYPEFGSLSNWFYDYDDSLLNYQVHIWDDNVTGNIMMIGSMTWINFQQAPNWFGETKMTIRATDGSLAFAEKTVKLTVLPVNDIPVITSLSTIYVTAGKEATIDISNNISDVEDPYDVLLLSTNMPEYAHGLSGKLYFMFPVDFTGAENSTQVQLTLTVRDLDGGLESTNITVIVQANTEDTRQAEQIYLWWLIGMMAAIAGLILFIILSRKVRGPFMIQDVMLIHKNGLLLARCEYGSGVKVDDDVFSGMLTAVLDFVDESFKRDEDQMHKFEFKDYSVLLHRGRDSFLAIAYSGISPRDIDVQLGELMTRIENIYGARIENFSGDTAGELNGIEMVLNDFIAENSKKTKIPDELKAKNGGNGKEPIHSA